MSTFKEFDNTLEELETEVGKLKTVSDAYQKIQGLVTSSAVVTQQLEVTHKNLDDIRIGSLEAQISIAHSISKLEETHQALANKTNALIENKIEEIRSENKSNYREIEDTIKRRLEDNRLEIKLLIESERIQIKEIFKTELASKFNLLEVEWKKITDQLAEKQKQTRTMILALGTVTILISAAILIKLLIG